MASIGVELARRAALLHLKILSYKARSFDDSEILT
jgi:hypothetical protein